MYPEATFSLTVSGVQVADGLASQALPRLREACGAAGARCERSCSCTGIETHPSCLPVEGRDDGGGCRRSGDGAAASLTRRPRLARPSCARQAAPQPQQP